MRFAHPLISQSPARQEIIQYFFHEPPVSYVLKRNNTSFCEATFCVRNTKSAPLYKRSPVCRSFHPNAKNLFRNKGDPRIPIPEFTVTDFIENTFHESIMANLSHKTANGILGAFNVVSLYVKKLTVSQRICCWPSTHVVRMCGGFREREKGPSTQTPRWKSRVLPSRRVNYVQSLS